MNYLSHFYIDQIPGNHLYNFGLWLPDVSRSFVKSFKSDPEIALTDDEKKIVEGCLRHYRSDAIFHKSEFFENLLKDFTLEINQAGLSEFFQRKWFVAHVMAELMIDRCIVKSIPHIVDAYYEAIDRVPEELVAGLLVKYQGEETERFITLLRHFKSIRYIYHYSDNNKFVYSLTRVMMRAGIPEPTNEDRGLLLMLTDKLEKTYFSKPEHVLKSMSDIFI